MTADFEGAITKSLGDASLGRDAASVAEAVFLGLALPSLLPDPPPVGLLRDALAARWPVPVSRDAFVRRVAASPDPILRAVLAEDAHLPEDVVFLLAEDPDPGVQAILRHNPLFDARIAAQLERDLDEAASAATPRWRLEELARSPRASVRGRIAGSPFSTPSILDALAADVDPEVRLAVALNPLAPAGALQSMLVHRDLEMARALAAHPRSPPAVLEALAADRRPEVRQALCGNPFLPAALVQTLLGDGSDLTMLRHPGAGIEALEHAVDRVASYNIQQLLEIPRFPEGARLQLLARFGRTFDGGLLACLARDTRAPPAMLERLADRVLGHPGDRRCRGVLLALLANPGLAPARREGIVAVLGAEDPDVDEALATNPALPDARRIAAYERLAGDDRRTERIASSPRPFPGLLQKLADSGSSHLQQVVAKHPATPGDLLRTLAASPDPGVRRAVARNPAAPLDVVQALLRDRDETVLRELEQCGVPPVLRPELRRHALHARGEERRGEAFGRVRAPSIRERGARSEFPAIRKSVALDPGLSASSLEALARDPDVSVRHLVLGRLKRGIPAPQSILARDPDRLVRSWLAEYTSDPAILTILAGDTDPTVRRAVAGRTDAPLDLLERLATDADGNVRGTLARNSAVPPRILDDLAREDSFEGANPSLPRESWRHILERIGADEGRLAARLKGVPDLEPDLIVRILELAGPTRSGDDLRAHAARFPSTPRARLAELHRDATPAIRAGLARNPSTPDSVLEELLRTGDVVLELAMRQAPLPESVLEGLAVRKEHWILDSFVKRAGLPAGIQVRLAATTDLSARRTLAANPDLEPGAMSRLLEFGDPTTRTALARNPAVASQLSILDQLARDPGCQAPLLENPALPESWRRELQLAIAGDEASPQPARESLASNPATPSEAIAILALAREPRLRVLVARRQDLSPEIVESLAGDPDGDVRRAIAGRPGGLVRVLARHARGPVAWLRLVAAAHPELPELERETLARSASWSDRLGAALNPALPRATRELLESDADERVREVARAMPASPVSA